MLPPGRTNWQLIYPICFHHRHEIKILFEIGDLKALGQIAIQNISYNKYCGSLGLVIFLIYGFISS